MSAKKHKSKGVYGNPKEIKANQIWNADKMNKLRTFILSESKKQSPERRMRSEMLALKYQIQDYIENENIEKKMRIFDFLKLYLKILNIPRVQVARKFEMNDSNLYKYLIGERKLNPDLAMKLSSFSHTKPELWFHIQTKNELFELEKEKEKMEEYKKYTYEKILAENIAG
jgi:antitoxin HigA-1